MPASDQIISLGEIVSTHGIDGWLKLNPYNPDTTILRAPLDVVLDKEQVRGTFELESSRPQKRQILIKLRGINSIGDAQHWVGCALGVAEEALPALAPGEYYHYQAIGLEVFDTHGQRIGIVARTWATPAGEIYVVTGESKEHLIPAVKEIIEHVDLATGKMTINPPRGLLDL
jgi:16S rRNA processing protein RimM